MKKRLPWILTLLAIAAGGLGYWRYRVMHRAPEVQYKTAPVERRHIVGRVTASGTLSMTNTATNQDACQGATLTLGFTTS